MKLGMEVGLGPAILCSMGTHFSDVNKDLTCKAKAKAKDLSFKAKAKAKDLTCKAKPKAKDSTFKAKAKDFTFKAKAKAKDFTFKAKPRTYVARRQYWSLEHMLFI